MLRDPIGHDGRPRELAISCCGDSTVTGDYHRGELYQTSDGATKGRGCSMVGSGRDFGACDGGWAMDLEESELSRDTANFELADSHLWDFEEEEEGGGYRGERVGVVATAAESEFGLGGFGCV